MSVAPGHHVIAEVHDVCGVGAASLGASSEDCPALRAPAPFVVRRSSVLGDEDLVAGQRTLERDEVPPAFLIPGAVGYRVDDHVATVHLVLSQVVSTGRSYAVNALGAVPFDAWDRWQPELGDVFAVGPHIVGCCDLETGQVHTLAEDYGPFEMVYTDPPWGPGVARAFRTKAGVDGDQGAKVDWGRFEALTVDLIVSNCPWAWIEMGNNQAQSLIDAFTDAGATILGRWAMVARESPNGHSMVVVSFGDLRLPAAVNYNGVDSRVMPGLAIADAGATSVFDPFCGLGCTAMHAIRHGAHFVGAELAPRRMAETMSVLSALTGDEPELIATVQ